MISEKNIKTILMVFLILSLSVYLLISEITPLIFPSIFQGTTQDSFKAISLLKFGGLVVSLFTIIATVNIKFITKIFLGKNYIAGKYLGRSSKKSKDKELENPHSEKFEINQSLVSTKISGISKDEEGNYCSSWHGYLVDYDNRNYKFMVRLETKTEELLGVMNFTIYDDELYGFAIVVGTGTRDKWIFEAKKSS